MPDIHCSLLFILYYYLSLFLSLIVPLLFLLSLTKSATLSVSYCASWIFFHAASPLFSPRAVSFPFLRLLLCLLYFLLSLPYYFILTVSLKSSSLTVSLFLTGVSLYYQFPTEAHLFSVSLTVYFLFSVSYRISSIFYLDACPLCCDSSLKLHAKHFVEYCFAACHILASFPAA